MLGNFGELSKDLLKQNKSLFDVSDEFCRLYRLDDDFPNYRGVASFNGVTIWVNEEDHLRIMSLSSSISECFDAFCEFLEVFESSLRTL